MRSAFLVNAFADRRSSGSPTAVVLRADGLDRDRMLAMARGFPASHTAFASSSRAGDDCELRVRFFTHEGEIGNCAHATIALHCLLATRGRGRRTEVVRQRTSGGVQEVRIRRRGGDVTVALRQDEVTEKTVCAEDLAALLTCLRLTHAQLDPSWPAALASPGAYRYLVPLVSIGALTDLRPDLEALREFSLSTRVIGCFALHLAQGREWAAHGRMFAPAIGVGEDIVNGNSAGCLGAYLLRRRGASAPSDLRLEVHQGVSSGRPSTVFVEARWLEGRPETFVAGSAHVVSELPLPGS